MTLAARAVVKKSLEKVHTRLVLTVPGPPAGRQRVRPYVVLRAVATATHAKAKA